MNYKIYRPLAFSEQGRKPNQEDRIFPDIDKLNVEDRCFVLCDGMGGHEHGEVAAEIVATTLQPELLGEKGSPDLMTVERFKKALAKTYTELDKMPVDDGKRPGTTMTALYLAENGAFVAHIGDSRVYQLRPRQGVVFRTSDHSLVNELFKAGELTEEEARNYPRKNIITRAMQPCLEVPYKADTSILTDVRPGDFFFMCTDGILENITDEKLVAILSKDDSDQDKLNAIFNECYTKTRDNFTCILVHIEDVTGDPLPTPEPIKEDTGSETAIVDPAAHAENEIHYDDIESKSDDRDEFKTADAAFVRAQVTDNDHKSLRNRIILIAIVVIALLVAGYFLFFNNPKELSVTGLADPEKPTKEVRQTTPTQATDAEPLSTAVPNTGKDVDDDLPASAVPPTDRDRHQTSISQEIEDLYDEVTGSQKNDPSRNQSNERAEPAKTDQTKKPAKPQSLVEDIIKNHR